MQCLGKPGRSGRKSFVATPEQRNNVKILVGLGVPQAMTRMGWKETVVSEHANADGKPFIFEVSKTDAKL